MAKKMYVGATATPIPISEIAVGHTVKLNVHGVARDFIVVQQGNPDDYFYHSSCDGTWLLMKDIIEDEAWISSSNTTNEYEKSNIHNYINNTFITYFDSGIQSIIKQVKIPYIQGTTSSRSVKFGANGLSTKVFLLSAKEVGFATGADMLDDGLVLDYFAGCDDSQRIAYKNDTSSYWWLRSTKKSSNDQAIQVANDGYMWTQKATGSYGLRPAIILPSNTTVLGGVVTTSTSYDNVACEVKKIYVGVDGVAKNVKKGYIGVDGVARQFFASGKPISTLAVGTTIKMNVNGTKREFIIVNQGIPSGSSLYDSSCNGTWLMMKDIYEKRQWGLSGQNNNNYAQADIHSYLNSTFLSLFDSNIQSIIKQVKLPYTNGSGTVYSGSNGLSTRIFLLTGYECGWTTSDNSRFTLDGAKLTYFGSSANGNGGRIAYYNGSASTWWLRTTQGGWIFHVKSDGEYFSSNVRTSSEGIRPALILPFETLVSDGVVITE